jgi:ribosomal protein S18 acetylase RimI-like enzyme
VTASAGEQEQPLPSPRTSMPTDSHGPSVRLIECRYDDPDAALLVNALYTEQVATYGFADRPELDPPVTYQSPAGLFVVAYAPPGRSAAEAVGCGGVRTYDPDRQVAEIRKMYVRPAWRGRGVGHHILDHLERHAAAGHARSVLLETGVHNTAAIRLYTSVGYQPIQPYVPGRKDANRAFAKTLLAPGQVS